MKGFGIYIVNDLLEPKHINAMGKAVWLYMWLIDHMTSVDEAGVGKILGGRPVKYTEIARELGISQDTYTQWIEKLVEYPYIKTTRTPHGIVFHVLKAKKRFRKNTERFRENTERFRESAECNIRPIKDNTKTIRGVSKETGDKNGDIKDLHISKFIKK